MPDLPTPDPLGDALQAWGAAPGPATAAGVYAALAQAVVLIPVQATVLAEHTATITGLRAEKEAELAVLTVALDGGRRVLPVFTTAEAMRRWRIEARPVRAPMPEACRAAVDEAWTGLVIDPGSHDFVVGMAATRALADGFVPVAGDEARSFGAATGPGLPPTPIGQPTAEVMAALRRALAREPAVAQAWLLRADPALEVGVLPRAPLDPAGLATITARLSARLAQGTLTVAALDADTAAQAAEQCPRLWP